ncbi:MAG: BON domain-containing protein [Nitrospirae bacterium]|nr:BON domain-containing protein [Candidatus Manganitrophaceae bacterium]
MARVFGYRRSFFPSVFPSRTTMLLAGLTVGILFAPRTGRSTRALISQKYQYWMSTLSGLLEQLAEKTRTQSRLQGVTFETRERSFFEEAIESDDIDDILEQRVKGELGRFFNLVSVEVSSQNGIITLRGSIPNEQERQSIVDMAKKVRGVRDVISVFS